MAKPFTMLPNQPPTSNHFHSAMGIEINVSVWICFVPFPSPSPCMFRWPCRLLFCMHSFPPARPIGSLAPAPAPAIAATLPDRVPQDVDQTGERIVTVSGSMDEVNICLADLFDKMAEHSDKFVYQVSTRKNRMFVFGRVTWWHCYCGLPPPGAIPSPLSRPPLFWMLAFCAEHEHQLQQQPSGTAAARRVLRRPCWGLPADGAWRTGGTGIRAAAPRVAAADRSGLRRPPGVRCPSGVRSAATAAPTARVRSASGPGRRRAGGRAGDDDSASR